MLNKKNSVLNVFMKIVKSKNRKKRANDSSVSFISTKQCLYEEINTVKNLKNASDNPIFRFIASSHNTRGNNMNLVCPQYRTTLFKNSLSCLGTQIWNSLPLTIKQQFYTVTFSQFKRIVKGHFRVRASS